jgi:hypothetical protein
MNWNIYYNTYNTNQNLFLLVRDEQVDLYLTMLCLSIVNPTIVSKFKGLDIKKCIESKKNSVLFIFEGNLLTFLLLFLDSILDRFPNETVARIH